MRKLSLLTIAFVLGLLTQLDAQPYKVIYVFGSHPGDPADLGFVTTISQSPGGYLLGSSPFTEPDVTRGIAFEMSTGGGFKSLHTFTGLDGASPVGGLILATDQRFHGTTQFGGQFDLGTVFRLSPDGKVTVEHSFAGGSDGEYPQSAPIQSTGGHFYGVTAGQFSPTNGATNGTIYRISKAGEYSVLHAFSGSDGAHPFGPLLQGNDGQFYGTTLEGGSHNLGTIFRVGADGKFKVLYNFDGTHGSEPFGPLIQASDGRFYGSTASGGGPADAGVIFKISPAGSLTVLHTFSGDDGRRPVGGLVQASDGNFYGTSQLGGLEGFGTLYRLTLAGTFTKLHDFVGQTGANPEGTLLQHTNGRLYGYTFRGGIDGIMYEYDLGLSPFVTWLPVYGRVGAKVVILGQDFENNSIVSFNGVSATDVKIHPTYLKAIVPDGATTGDINVTTTSGTFKSNKVFVVH